MDFRTAFVLVFFYMLYNAETYKTDERFEKLENDLKSLKSEVKVMRQRNLKEVQVLRQKISAFSRNCELQTDDICGPCLCRDDDKRKEKYYCDCRNLQPKRDCLEFKQYGMTVSGIYKVHQNILKIIYVYCDQQTDGGGWTVVQRRNDGSINFMRNWESYKDGFGELQNEFWLGLENLYTMSLNGMYPRGNELRIDLMNLHQVKRYAKYSRFFISDAQSKYLLHISGFSGNIADKFIAHNLHTFSTYDQDNDKWGDNCAKTYQAGGWWLGACYGASLNGLYYPGGIMSIRTKGSPIEFSQTGIHWFDPSFNLGDESLIQTQMLLRRKL